MSKERNGMQSRREKKKFRHTARRTVIKIPGLRDNLEIQGI
jgi:hypothetical protein